MIRPLSEALYDYRRVHNQDSNPSGRENYKRYYLEACMFIGAENIYSRVNEGASLDEAIEEWNREGEKATPDKQQEKDYKGRLDEVFLENGKGYYKKKEDSMIQRSLSKQKSEDKREADRSRERPARDNYHFVYDHPRQYEGNYLYKRRSEDHSHRARDRY